MQEVILQRELAGQYLLQVLARRSAANSTNVRAGRASPERLFGTLRAETGMCSPIVTGQVL